jgi:hypothetical protein
MYVNSEAPTQLTRTSLKSKDPVNKPNPPRTTVFPPRMPLIFHSGRYHVRTRPPDLPE